MQKLWNRDYLELLDMSAADLKEYSTEDLIMAADICIGECHERIGSAYHLSIDDCFYDDAKARELADCGAVDLTIRRKEALVSIIETSCQELYWHDREEANHN